MNGSNYQNPAVLPAQYTAGSAACVEYCMPGTQHRLKKSLLLFLLSAVFLIARGGSAQPNLSIDPESVTWNIIGLDHNNVNVGPQDYPVGVRVLNTGNADALNVTATFMFTSPNTHISLLNSDTVTTTVIPAGGYADFYFTVRVARISTAYNTTRDYKITVTGGGLTTPLVTEDTLFVQELVSQEANDVLSLVGPSTIQQGEVRTFILTSETQKNKEQLENFVNFPNDIFQVLSIETTFSHPGDSTDRLYVDACGWVRDNLPPDNDSCDGPDMFGGTVGGSVITVYQVLVLQTPSEDLTLSALILDNSGNAYHYNSDFGENIIVLPRPADLFVVKTAISTVVEAGSDLDYLITVVNPSQTITAEDVVLIDQLPAGLTLVSGTPPPSTGPNPQVWNIGDMAASSTLTFSLRARTSCTTTGSLTNTATVSSTTPDTNPNNNSSSQTILVRDTTPPAIQCPAPIVATADPGVCSKGNVTFTITSSDNCGGPVTVTASPASGSTFPVGVTVVTVTARDNAGNTSSCTFTVTIVDSTPPQISCPANIDLAADAQSCSRANVNLGTPTASDNCTSVTVTATRSDGMPLNSPFPVGTTVVTWKATDDAGLMATCAQQVTIRDATNPVIQCPANMTVNADAGQCSKSNVTYTATATDNCGTVTVTLTPPSGSTLPVGTTTVTAKATDNAGNMATCTFTVTVVDTQLPTITCPPTVNVSAGPNGCQAENVNIMMPTVSDNCLNPTVMGTRSDGQPLNAPFPVGTTIITWKVTDASNNMATCQQQVIVADITPPTITCPPTVTVTANAQNCMAANVNIGTPATSDNCSTQTIVGVRSDGQPLNAPFPLGSTTIVWTVTDTSGNTASCEQLVIVRDMTAPSITCPSAVNVSNAPGQCGANVTFTVSAVDSCGNTGLVISSTPASGSFFPVGTTTVTSTATDAAGNTATCSFTVTVADTQNPTLICPPNIVTCMQDVVLGTRVTADNCATATLTVVRSDNLPLNADYPVGTTLVTYTLTDTAGNMSSCVQTVMVSPSVLPQIICPADITVNALAGQCVSGPVEYPDPTVLDNCSTDTTGLTITFTPPEGSTFPVGETIVTAKVTDPMQNMAQCTFRVRVVDVTPPPLVCPANIVVNNTPGVCGAGVANFSIPPVTDPCSNPVTVVANPPAGTIFPVGTTPVVVTATDSAGNSATCTFTVTVNDTQPPTIVCPPQVNVMADANLCQATNVDLGVPVTADNCTTASVTGSRSDGLALSAPYPVGTTTVTWTVTDASGNTSSCPQIVLVRDTMMPEITCPPNITVDALTGQCVSGPVEYGNTIVSDNCSANPTNLTVTFNPPSGSTFPLGVNTVTATVTDAGGNQASCTFTVTVRDVTPPTITCPANIVVGSSPGQCGNGQVNFQVTASDLCSNPVTVVTTPPSGSAFPAGTTTVVATATDSAGNSAMCSFTVTVNDTEPPQITCPGAMMIMTSPGVCEAQNVTYSAQATDNCQGPVTVTFIPPSGSTLPPGVTTVVATATDAAGNSASCTFTVTVNDQDAPRIACGDTITVDTVPCELDAVVNLVPPEVEDPCGQATVAGVRSDGRPLTDRYPAGTTTVTWTATDAAGNQASCTQQVVVNESDCAPVCDGPDLIIMTKMAPTFKCSKAPVCRVKGWYVVTNIGTQTSGETSVCFYLSDDEVVDAGDFQFKPNKKRHRVKSLRPGEMVGVDLNGKAPKGVSVEGKFIIGLVDCPGLVVECREDNNTTADHPMPKMK